MPASYNLRSLQRKRGFSGGNCYLQTLSENRSFNPKVNLERVKLLECRDFQNSRFYLQKGEIKVKENKSSFSNVKFLLKVCCMLILLVTSVVYWREYLQTSGIAFARKCSEIHPSLQSFYADAVKFQRNIFSQFKTKPKKVKKEDEKLIIQTSKENSTSVHDNTEIRQLVRDYFIEVKRKSKIQNTAKSPLSFIEEQCRRDSKINSFSKRKVFYNVTFHDMANLTDYALESQGAEIVTVFDTELYGTITVKYLNINLWPELSHFLMKYLKCFSVNGPNSILMPWKKPGDCWAFKGSRGRVQIKLSDEIIVTAITVDHIPKEISSKSAPKKFSLSGVQYSNGNDKRVFLGSFEYNISGPAAQTFFIQPKVNVSFSTVEVAIESNHGNEKYTCVYKVRIHGHK